MPEVAVKTENRVLKNILWLAFSNFFGKGFTFISGIITARILFPEDFGIISMAATFSGFIEFTSQIGAEAFIVSKQNISKKEINTVYFINILIGLAFAIVMFAGAPIAASIYKTPEVKNILLISAFSFFLTFFSGVPRAMLVKEMKQNTISKIDMLRSFLTTSMIIIMAVLGFRYLSFVIPQLITSIITCLIYLILTRWKFEKTIESNIIKEVLTYSKSFMPKTLLSYLVYNSDYIIIGFLLGPKLLGFYYFGFQKALMVTGTITNIGCAVFFPLFAKLQNDGQELKKTFLSINEKQMFITYPLVISQIILAKEMIYVLFGAKWADAVLIFQLILVYTIGRTISSNIHILFDAVGKPQHNLKHFITFTPLCIIALLVGTKLGSIYGAAIAALLVNTLGFYLLYIRFCKVFNWNFKDLIINSLRPAIPALVQLPLIFVIKTLLVRLGVSDFLILALVSLIYSVLYIVLAKFLVPDIYERNFKAIKQKIINKIYSLTSLKEVKQ